MRVKQTANRRLRDLLADDDATPAPFICECADATCGRAVWLTQTAYDRTTANRPERAVSAHCGHVDRSTPRQPKGR
jgi:hypothetical protein